MSAFRGNDDLLFEVAVADELAECSLACTDGVGFVAPDGIAMGGIEEVPAARDKAVEERVQRGPGQGCAEVRGAEAER